MPEGTKNYSITELGLCGLAINTATLYTYWRRKINAVVDHLVFAYITHNKNKKSVKDVNTSLNYFYWKAYDMSSYDVIFFKDTRR